MMLISNVFIVDYQVIAKFEATLMERFIFEFIPS